MTALTRLGERLVAMRDGGIDEELAGLVCRRIYDGLGAAAIGLATDDGRTLREIAQSLTGGSGIARNDRDRCRLLVGTARATEVDDIDIRGCTTAGAVVIPTTLSFFAQRERAGAIGGERLLPAIVTGYEAMLSFGRALDGARLIYRGVWPTLAVAAVGAAAAVGTGLGLDAERLENALGLALQRVTLARRAALAQPAYRPFVLGAASVDGWDAAHAAMARLESADAVLDDYLRTIETMAGSAAFDAAIVAEGDGTPLISQVDSKTWPTSRQALASVAAFRSLLPLDLDRVESIRVAVPADYLHMVDQPALPDSRIGSMIGVQYALALAATDSSVLFDVRRTTLPNEASVLGWMGKVHVESDADLTRRFPAVWGSRVEVRLRSGEAVAAETLVPDGAASRPLDWEALDDKYRTLTSASGLDDADRFEALGAGCRALVRSSSGHCESLLALTAGSGEPRRNAMPVTSI
jgi:2-methylcitrate dehydratase PrpD